MRSRPDRLRGSLSVAVVVMCGLLIAGCAGGAPSASAPGEGAAWHRLQTEHVDLVTDVSAASAESAALALERTREALLRAAWSKLSTTRQTQRLHVVLLARGLDFERYFGRNVDGFHTSLGGDTIVIWGTPANWERRQRLTDVSTTSTFRHELVHHLAAGIYGRQPRWFAEGLADFLETMSIGADGTKAALGKPNLAASRAYRATRALGVKDALAWGPKSTPNEVETRGLYGLSWMMVTWMFNTQRDAFDAYQRALARGEAPDRAWSASFGSWDLGDMDRAIYQYALHGDATVYDIDLAPVEAQATTAPLGAADVHALRAQLALIAATLKNGGDRAFEEEAGREIAEALAVEPGHVATLRLSHASPHPLSAAETLARVREQTQRRPDDGEAWLFLASRLRGRGRGSRSAPSALRQGRGAAARQPDRVQRSRLAPRAERARRGGAPAGDQGVPARAVEPRDPRHLRGDPVRRGALPGRAPPVQARDVDNPVSRRRGTGRRARLYTDPLERYQQGVRRGAGAGALSRAGAAAPLPVAR